MLMAFGWKAEHFPNVLTFLPPETSMLPGKEIVGNCSLSEIQRLATAGGLNLGDAEVYWEP